LLEEAGVESLSWGSLGPAAQAKVLMGDRAGAEEAWKAKWQAYPVEDGKTQSLAIAANYSLANLYCDEGRWDEAEERMARYRHVDSGGNVRRQVEARLAAHRGEHEQALELARDLVERTRRGDSLNTQAVAWQLLAEVQRAAGLSVEADSSSATALALYERKGNLAAAALVRGAVTA
jgi:tetratricopeptide (TPR) repeat protein